MSMYSNSRYMTRGIVYIGTYLERDLAGLRRLMDEPSLSEVVFLFDGRSKDGRVDDLSEDILNGLITSKEPSDIEKYYKECKKWAKENYADSWSLVSRENLCEALKEYGQALSKFGKEVKVKGCNPRDSKEALKFFGEVILEGILEGKRIAYAEASITRVGSPIMRWLLSITDSKIFFVPPKEWADPFFTFIVNPRIAGKLGEIIDAIGRIDGHLRDEVVGEIEELSSKIICEYIKNNLINKLKKGSKGKFSKKIEELKNLVEGMEHESCKNVVESRVKFNRELEAKNVEEIPLLVLKKIIPADRGISINNPLLVLKAIYEATNGGKNPVSVKELTNYMKKSLPEKLRSLVTYQKLKPVLDLLDGRFIIKRKSGRRVNIIPNSFGKAFAEAIPDKIYEAISETASED